MMFSRSIASLMIACCLALGLFSAIDKVTALETPVTYTADDVLYWSWNKGDVYDVQMQSKTKIHLQQGQQDLKYDSTTTIDGVLVVQSVSDQGIAAVHWTVRRVRLDNGEGREWLRNLVYGSRLLSVVLLRMRTLVLQWEYDLGHSSPPHLYTAEFYTEELLEPTRRAFAGFRRLSRAHGLDAAVVLIPDKDQVYKPFANEEERHRPNRVLSEILSELAIPYVDLLPQFLPLSGDPLYNMTPAGHLSVRGHLKTAEILRAYSLELEARSLR